MKFRSIVLVLVLVIVVLFTMISAELTYAAEPTATPTAVPTLIGPYMPTMPPVPTPSVKCTAEPTENAFTAQGKDVSAGWLATIESDAHGCPISVATIAEDLPQGSYQLGIIPVPGFYPGNVGWHQANAKPEDDQRLGVGTLVGLFNMPINKGSKFWIYDDVPYLSSATTSKAYLYILKVASPQISTILGLPPAYEAGCVYDWIQALDPDACRTAKEIRVLSKDNPIVIADFHHPVQFDVEEGTMVDAISILGYGTMVSMLQGKAQKPNLITTPGKDITDMQIPAPKGDIWTIQERWTVLIVFIQPELSRPPSAAAAVTQAFCADDGGHRSKLKEQGYTEGEAYCKDRH